MTNATVPTPRRRHPVSVHAAEGVSASLEPLQSSAMGMTADELRGAVEADEIDTVIVAFTDLYGRLLGKRYEAGFFCEHTLGDGTHACDYLLTVDMEMEPVPGYHYASWDLGYGDFHLMPDLTTLRRAAWTERAAFVLCDVIDDTAHADVAVAPRSILRRQLARLDAFGLTAKAASELEFFIFDDTYREAHAAGYTRLQPAGWYIEDYHLLSGSRVEGYVGAARTALSKSGIPVENSKGEWGRGQHELNIRYADAMAMADRHTIMKHALKDLADSMGVSVTFMAKPSSDEAGSSSHIHLSLWNTDTDDNAFVGEGTTRSDMFRWFLGGWLAHVEDFMVCYAPTVNSYKRYIDGSWAPTRLAWSGDNRTAGFRVVGSGDGLRIENRIPGADCNPYLAYAASIASGIAGIEQRIEPPDEFVGDAYHADAITHVPRTLAEATSAFSRSSIARAAFGDDVVDHYTHFHEVEIDAFNTSVTDWERSRYFERI